MVSGHADCRSGALRGERDYFVERVAQVEIFRERCQQVVDGPANVVSMNVRTHRTGSESVDGAFLRDIERERTRAMSYIEIDATLHGVAC